MTVSESYNVYAQQDTPVMSACFCLVIYNSVRLLSTRNVSFYSAAFILNILLNIYCIMHKLHAQMQ